LIGEMKGRKVSEKLGEGGRRGRDGLKGDHGYEWGE